MKISLLKCASLVSFQNIIVNCETPWGNVLQGFVARLEESRITQRSNYTGYLWHSHMKYTPESRMDRGL